MNAPVNTGRTGIGAASANLPGARLDVADQKKRPDARPGRNARIQFWEGVCMAAAAQGGLRSRVEV